MNTNWRGGGVLTSHEAMLAAALLDKAADKFSNHGCNDFFIDEHVDDMTDEEMAGLDLAMHEHNGDPEEHDPEEDHNVQQDWCLMLYLAARLRGEV